jgi:hypothetical protein
VELSERKLEKVIQAVASLQSESAGRLSPRMAVQATMTMLPFAHGRTGQPREVGLHDISGAGVAVIDSQPMAMGTQFKLLIPRRMRRPIEVLCTVRHCRQSEGGFILGAEYGVSWLETLGTLIAPRPAKMTQETSTAEIAVA